MMIMARPSSVVTSALLTVPTSLPWSITLIRSARSKTSWMSWLIRKIPMPSVFSCWIRLRTWAVSAGPTAALGPAETAQVRNLIQQLKTEGIGIFLISHDIHDVFDLADRISVMLHGKLVGTVNKADVTTDEGLAMIIMGKLPDEVTQTELAQLHS